MEPTAPSPTTTADPTTQPRTGVPRPAAWSIGRRWFDFEAPVATPVAIGGHVLITCGDGRRFIGQVTEAGLAPNPASRALAGGGNLLARESDTGWASVDLTDTFDDADMDVSPGGPVADWLTNAVGDTGVLEHGTTGPTDRPVRLRAAGFNRHTFLCGQSGSGKTYTMGRLLEQLLLETELQIVVLDPNSDYVRLNELGLPDDDPEAARVAALQGRICVFRTGDAPYRLRVRFGRFPLSMQALVLALDPLRDASEYDVLRRLTESMGTNEYSLRDLREQLDEQTDPGGRLALRIDNMGVLTWSIWAEHDEAPLLDQLPEDWRAAVVDLGQLASAPERSAVSAAILAGLWARRHDRKPVLLVIDEAHNVCPQEPSDHNQALAVERAISIAAEGRKFGLYLLLATQRPQKVHANVLTQCENLILMRMNSRADIAHLAEVFSHVPASLIEQAAGFELGEGLVAGRIVPFPSLFRTGARRSPEGGSDVPTSWAQRSSVPGPRPSPAADA